MKTIVLHPQAIQAFNHEARQKISENGIPLQTLGYLLGYEENGNIRTTELIFPFQEATSDSVVELGNKILFFIMTFLISYLFLQIPQAHQI